MNRADSILIMIHCKQFTGFAVGVLEKVFFDAAKQAGYSDENIYWSYKSVLDKSAVNVFAFDYHSNSDYRSYINLLKAKRINQVIAFDLHFPAPIISVLKKAGVNRIISYWGASMSSINKGMKLQLKRLEYLLTLNKPDLFIFESEAMRLSATQGRGVPHSKTTVIPLGVDVTKFNANYDCEKYAHRELNIPTSRKLIFYSGHMEERKGVRVLIQCAIQLADKMKIEDFHFVICGNKGDEARLYQELLMDTKAESHVTFAGYRSDIAELMASSYIGAIASTGWDSFTMSSVEMMASGLPMIVSNLQGLAETIENEVNGFHIAPGDFSELAESIDYLLKHPEQAKCFSAASRRRAVSLFSREKQVDRIAGVLSIG